MTRERDYLAAEMGTVEGLLCPCTMRISLTALHVRGG